MRKLGRAALAATMVGGLSAVCVGFAAAQNAGVACTQENGSNSRSIGSLVGSGHAVASNDVSSCGTGIRDNDSSSGDAVGGTVTLVSPTTQAPAP